MTPAIAAAASFALALLFTPLVIWVAHARGLLAKPREDRWHKKPTALFGGVAIFLAVAVAGVIALPWTRANAGILLGAATIFAVGLVDDVLRIKPSSKLIGQIAAACVAVVAGVHVEAISTPFLFVPVTIVWIVAITNAFNLIDNMDGLSAGVAAISAFFIVLFAQSQGNAEVAMLAAILGGAAAGFLVFNFNPARVFMGDCGSMVLGYVLGCAALVGTWHQASNLFLIIAAPALLLAVPIFDATLVTVLRTLAGRPVSQGGRDHSSHRLVALGLSERRAVLLLWTVCVIFGGIALAGLKLNLFAAAVGGLLLVVGIFFFGVFLGGVPVYGKAPEKIGPGAPVLVNTLLLHKRRVAEVVVDFALICAAYASAYLLRYEGVIPAHDQRLIVETLPILVFLKLSAFFLFGVYRGVWKYVGIRDAISLAKAVLAGSIAAVLALLLIYRFEGLSRSVFVLDGLLLLFYAAGARVLLRVFRETLVSQPGGKRILVVGAGDGGEMLLREIRNNPGLGWTPVGIVDDDREKHGRRLHGVPVLGSRDELSEIASRTGAEEIVIAIPSASGERLAELAAACAATGLPYRTTRRLTELVDGRVTLDSIRELDVLDVVQRHAPRIDDAVLRAAVEGKAIAIVGAGGTIGAAVARRAAEFAPSRVLLLDRDDNGLLATNEMLPSAEAVIAEAGSPALASALARFRPDIVLHSTSLNQMPLLDTNVAAAARANVHGANAVAKASREAGAKVFVLVSTVRAGHPASVLGATRRLGEIAALAFATDSFQVRALRLGNVLGSRGGILARFREQALAGGPITVTDPEAARFVLAADEAATAVLLAAAPISADLPRDAVLFADHGAQVRIADIAHAVARWADARHAQRPEVKVVGLRAGESLRDPEPGSLAPAGAGLTWFVPPERVDAIESRVHEIERAASHGDDARVRELLASALPAFGSPPANVIALRR